jgi:hypothetical protein
MPARPEEVTVSERCERGRCFCGGIVAELTGEPVWIGYDHDEDCRRAIGSPVVVWVGYRPAQFRVLQGVPTSFSKTPGVVRTFCGTCGTSISYADAGLPDEVYVTVGFLDHPEHFVPRVHAYWSQKVPWIESVDGSPRIEGYSRSRDPAIGTPKDRRG